MALWTWMDYLDHRMQNRVRDWFIEELSEAARFKIEERMKTAAALKNTEWPRWITPLVGFKGILELKREHANVQYRPLFCYGPRRDQLTLLFGAREIGDTFSPKDAPRHALQRKLDIDNNPKRVTPHAFHDDEIN